MEGSFTFQDLQDLQKLLAPAKKEGEGNSDEDIQQSVKSFGPGDIKAPKAKEKEYAGPYGILKGEGDEIWHPEEAKNTEVCEDLDPRETPEYEMKFKQSVGTEDVFFGMGFKTPGTASCEWLSIFIKLPSEIREKVELSVESEFLDLRSPKYRLHLPTPHPVDPNVSTAKWHTETATLEISLRLVRELDGINF